MAFKQAHLEFVAYHAKYRSGEHHRRLRKGHGHAEQEFLRLVWWPAFGTFQGLYPEYEIIDFDGRRRYLDFAYFRRDVTGGNKMKLALEVDGFGPHVTQLDRWKFTNQLRRQNHLILDGWSLLRFSYDEVTNEPWHCQRTVQQFMGQRSLHNHIHNLSLPERATVQLAESAGHPLVPGQVADHLGVGRKAAYKVLRRLVAAGWLMPVSGQKRIRSYRLHPRRIVGS